MSRNGRHLFTSESVTEGHPDKIADQISDAILDAIIAQDEKARVACETLVTTGIAFIAGEITTTAVIDYQAVVRQTITDVGYTRGKFGFDAETFAPTYTLIYGSPGRSLALEIAGRLGLNPSIVSAARQNISAREAQLAEHLAKVERDMRALEHEHRLATREREALEAGGIRLKQREEALRGREEASKRRLSEELTEQVRTARREIDDVIADLKAKTETIARTAVRQGLSTGDAGSARTAARAAIEAVVQRQNESAVEPEPVLVGRAPAVGDRVTVGGLGLQGVVTALHDSSAEIDVRGKRMRTNVRDLRVLGGPAPVAQVSVHVDLQPRGEVAGDLNVIGCTVDEALTRTERFLDESTLTDQRVVRVIHGYGTGQLKRAIAGYLQQHPLVAGFQTAAPEQGGGGVTVVELKD